MLEPPLPAAASTRPISIDADRGPRTAAALCNIWPTAPIALRLSAGAMAGHPVAQVRSAQRRARRVVSAVAVAVARGHRPVDAADADRGRLL